MTGRFRSLGGELQLEIGGVNVLGRVARYWSRGRRTSGTVRIRFASLAYQARVPLTRKLLLAAVLRRVAVMTLAR